MFRVVTILGSLISFIGAGVLHFHIQSLSNSKNPALPQYIYQDVDDSIAEMESYRKIIFLIAIIFLFITVYLFNKKQSENPELLDDEKI